MHTCPRVVYLGIVVYSNALLHVSLFLSSIGSRRYLPYAREGCSPKPQRGYGRPGPGGRDMGVPPFKTPTLNKGTQAAESMRDGYHPKMLLYALDKLFYIFAQIKNSHRDDKVMFAYDILCISANRCTDWCNRIEKTGISDTLALLNVEDAQHLERLAWAVYNGAILVGPRPKLSGTCTWCAVLAGLQRHIYRGCNDAAHCPPQTLGSWDHEERVEALHHVGSLSGQRQTSQPWRRSRSSSPQCSQTPAHEGQPRAMSPHTPSRCPHGATLLPCATAKCYCGATVPHDVRTTPKVASAVNISPHAWSSHSSEGTALASLDQDEALEDNFQTQHMLVRRVRRWGDSGSGSLAGGGLECTGGSPGKQAAYCLDIGEEEETLETVDPTW